VALHPLLTPAFGQADLSNCEQEQIHLAGSIQPHGALLLVRPGDLRIVQASANARRFLGLDREILGLSLTDIPGDLAEAVRPHAASPPETIPLAVRCRIGPRREAFDGLLHRPDGGGLIIELERAGPPIDTAEPVEEALRTILDASSIVSLCDEAASLFKEIIGYDRVMVYRFDDEGHGEVFSERREAHLEPYLGNRYPATDIPHIARRLYERNRIRVLVDVEYQPVPLVPRLSPLTGRELDMSLCFLRSMSPIHIQYLKNMGVGATLVASLMAGGRLWGLIACHNYVPREVHFETRAVCEVLAEAIATRIAALESFAQAQSELSVRRLEQRLIEAIARNGEWRMALFESPQSLLQPLKATGAALLLDGQVLTTGDVPGTQELRSIGAWLDRRPRLPVMATASLGTEEPGFVPMTDVASGLVAAPVSASPGEYLLWFRPERIRTVTWAGDPLKAVVIGDSPSDLSPRRSFAQWHQLVEGTSDPWMPADLTAARLISDTVADVILQFRSVRMLIAADQLKYVQRQVRASDSPVIIADAEGRLLLLNEACKQMLQPGHPVPQSLHDLPQLFSNPGDVRACVQALTDEKRAWRGETGIGRHPDGVRPLLVRADPVFATGQRVLGFVILLTDISERKEAEAARYRFQQGIIDRYGGMNIRLESNSDLTFRNLLAPVVENAQLAALEITDSAETGRIPDMLDSVRTSVTRSAELLEHLIWHAAQAARRDP